MQRIVRVYIESELLVSSNVSPDCTLSLSKYPVNKKSNLGINSFRLFPCKRRKKRGKQKKIQNNLAWLSFITERIRLTLYVLFILIIFISYRTIQLDSIPISLHETLTVHRRHELPFLRRMNEVPRIVTRN